MRKTRRPALAGILIFCLAWPAQAAWAAPAGAVEVAVTKEGAPAAGVELALFAANLGKVPLGTTDARGDSSFALDVANLGKVPVEVVADQCPDGDRVYLVASGAQAPEAGEDCKRRVVGVFTWGDARRLGVDLASGALAVEPRAPSPVASGGGANPHAKTSLIIGGTGLAILVGGLVIKKNKYPDSGLSCSQAPSQCGVNTALVLLGTAALVGGGVYYYLGQNKTAATQVAIGPRTFVVRQTIRF
jgi:hypothetical protein